MTESIKNAQKPEDSLLERLNEHGISVSRVQIIDSDTGPWYVKLLLAFSGWLASLFILSFLAASAIKIFDNTSACFVVGAVMFGVAYFVLRSQQSSFFEHIGIAVSLAGQALIIFALFRTISPTGFFSSGDGSHITFWLLILFFQTLLTAFMPSFIHALFSALGSAVSLYFLFGYLNLSYLFSGTALLITSWAWLNEFRHPRWHQKLNAIGYGYSLTLIPIKGSFIFPSNTSKWRHNSSIDVEWLTPAIGELLVGFALVYVAVCLLKRYNMTLIQPVAIGALAACAIFIGLSFELQGITVGLTLILLGFANSNRTLLGLGFLSLLLFISSYYYFLGDTLLEKSRILAILGAALLLIRWLTNHLLSSTKRLREGAKQ